MTKVQITSTLLVLYSQDDNITSDALTRVHPVILVESVLLHSYEILLRFARVRGFDTRQQHRTAPNSTEQHRTAPPEI